MNKNFPSKLLKGGSPQHSLNRLCRATEYAMNSVDEMNRVSKRAEEDLHDLQAAIMLEEWDIELASRFALISQQILYAHQTVVRNMTVAAQCTLDAVSEEFRF
jgi:hypothetical protein